MGLFTRRTLFNRSFLLDDDTLLFKNCICFSYKNIYDDNFVVQGFAISRDYCMVSAYNKFKAKSRVYLYEKNGRFSKYVELDNSSHVGGITYDYINDIVYITGTRGKINAYSYPELICGNIVKYDSGIDISTVIDGVVSAATVYFYDNKLYVCTFEGVGKMVVFDLEVSKQNIMVLGSKLINDLSPAIQGVTVFKDSGKLYYLFSLSFSRLPSIIKLYDDHLKFMGQIKLKEIGLEGIDIDFSGNVCCVFENGVDKMKKVHISDIVHGVNRRLDKRYYLKGTDFQEKLVNLKENVEKY